jgi:hypothetical protein
MRNLLFAFLVVLPAFASSQRNGIKQILIEPRFVVVSNIGLDAAIGDFSHTHTVGVTAGLGGFFKGTGHSKLGFQLEENYFIGKKISAMASRFEPENILRLVATVLVSDKNYHVLGGIHAGIAHSSSNGFNQDSFTFGVSVGAPVLGKIPLLGTLFRAKNTTAARLETLILLTPKLTSAGGGD